MFVLCCVGSRFGGLRKVRVSEADGRGDLILSGLPREHGCPGDRGGTQRQGDKALALDKGITSASALASFRFVKVNKPPKDFATNLILEHLINP